MCGLQEDIEHVRAVAVQVKQQGISVTEQLTATQMQTLQLQVRAYQSCSCPGLRLVCLKSMAGTARGRLCSRVGYTGHTVLSSPSWPCLMLLEGKYCSAVHRLVMGLLALCHWLPGCRPPSTALRPQRPPATRQ